MPVGYFFGNVLVTEQEFHEKMNSDFFQSLKKESLDADEKLRFQNGEVYLSELERPARTPVGIGLPFSIEILCIYTGDVPRSFLERKRDILVVSGVKKVSDTEPARRAINQMFQSADSHEYKSVSAFSEGSPIVYYTSAVDTSSFSCDIEMVADTFPDKLFNDVSTLLKRASGIPILLTSSAYLLAGSYLVKIATDLGKSLIESKAFLKDTLTFYFNTPEMPIPKPTTRIISNQDIQNFNSYIPGYIKEGDDSERPALIHKESGKEYQGNQPYILVSVDGRDRDQELKEFSVRYATAELLQQFYATDFQEKSTEILEQAMISYNDLNYFRKAKKIRKQMKGLEEGSKEYKEKKTYLDAYIKNIQNKDDFQF